LFPNVSGKKYIEQPAIADSIVNKIIGLKLTVCKEVRINCPLVEAIAPKAETIPKPVPLRVRGNISVMNKKMIAK